MPTHFDGTAEEKLALTTYIKLQRASSSFMSGLLRGGHFGNLTQSQFAVLEALHHLGPMCVGEIGGKVLKSDGNMTLVIDNLEKRGYVKRHRAVEDRRMVRVQITEQGEAVIAQLMPCHAAAITEMMSALSAEEQVQLGELCRKLGIAIAEQNLQSEAVPR